MRRVLVLVVVVVLAVVGCSDDDGGDAESDADTTTSSAASVEERPEPYDEYVRLAEDAGEDPIPREDAAIRASLNCDETGPDTFNGVPLEEFPTDFALVKAYCPDRLSSFG